MQNAIVGYILPNFKILLLNNIVANMQYYIEICPAGTGLSLWTNTCLTTAVIIIINPCGFIAQDLGKLKASMFNGLPNLENMAQFLLRCWWSTTAIKYRRFQWQCHRIIRRKISKFKLNPDSTLALEDVLFCSYCH